MLLHIQKTIEELKDKIRKNVEVINTNQQEIKGMLRQTQNEQSDQYEAFYSQNKRLLAQNNDLINVQLTLVNFLDKYRDTAILKEEDCILDIYSITDVQELFTLTIKGVVAFDSKHPYYSNPAFIDRLICYYESTEDYERCHELASLKEKILN